MLNSPTSLSHCSWISMWLSRQELITSRQKFLQGRSSVRPRLQVGHVFILCRAELHSDEGGD